MKYIYKDRDRYGKTRIYFWRGRGCRKIRIVAPPDSAAFETIYRQLLAGHIPTIMRARPRAADPRKSARAGTMNAVIIAYLRSADYLSLEASTRDMRRRVLNRIREKYGAAPVAMLEARHIRAGRDALAVKPGAAANWLKTMRALFKWALEAQLVAADPTRDVPLLKMKSDGFHTWTEDEVAAFEARHGPGSMARLALYLLLYTGARRSDVVRFGRQMESDGGATLRFRQRKTGGWLSVPVLPALRAEIDRHMSPADGTAAAQARLTYLVTSFGKGFSAKGFSAWMRARCDEAGLPHCTAHGLRKAGATRAANNGATAHQLMAIYGWRSLQDAERYTRAADQARLARSGIVFLETHKKEQK